MKRTQHPAPPDWVRAKRPPVKGDSPWWRDVAQELITRPGLVGSQLTIEAITEMVPCYPDGRQVRPRAVARRLAGILELVSRGPNGSLGRGAVYRIIRPRVPTPEHALVDDEWLRLSVERMLGKK